MSEHLTPLEVCLALIGPHEFVAEICGLSSKTTYHWLRASKGRAAGDIPSSQSQRALLDHSERHGRGLTAEHLIRGAKRAEVEAIRAARDEAALAFRSRVARKVAAE